MLASQVQDVLSRFMVRFMLVVGICWDFWMLDLGPSRAPWTKTYRNLSNLPEGRWCIMCICCMARGFQRSGEAELDSGGLNVRTRLYRARKVHPIESNNSMLVQLRSRLLDTMTPSKHV